MPRIITADKTELYVKDWGIGQRVILIQGWPLSDDLAAFKLPTLVIQGVDDKIVPIEASSRLTAKGIAASKLVEYAGAPHGLFATHKERLTKDLLDFLAQ